MITVPKTIEKYARDYMNTTNKESFEKVIKWLTKYTDICEEEIEDIFIVNKPCGNRQDISTNDGSEYCLQWSVGCDGDSFQGYYYHKMRES